MSHMHYSSLHNYGAVSHIWYWWHVFKLDVI